MHCKDTGMDETSRIACRKNFRAYKLPQSKILPAHVQKEEEHLKWRPCCGKNDEGI